MRVYASVRSVCIKCTRDECEHVSFRILVHKDSTYDPVVGTRASNDAQPWNARRIIHWRAANQHLRTFHTRTTSNFLAISMSLAVHTITALRSTTTTLGAMSYYGVLVILFPCYPCVPTGGEVEVSVIVFRPMFILGSQRVAQTVRGSAILDRINSMFQRGMKNHLLYGTICYTWCRKYLFSYCTGTVS